MMAHYPNSGNDLGARPGNFLPCGHVQLAPCWSAPLGRTDPSAWSVSERSLGAPTKGSARSECRPLPRRGPSVSCVQHTVGSVSRDCRTERQSMRACTCCVDCLFCANDRVINARIASRLCSWCMHIRHNCLERPDVRTWRTAQQSSNAT